MKVIVINGPMGVGKTTLGKYIADKYAGTAFIDGDWCIDIHPFIGNRETKTMAIDKADLLILDEPTAGLDVEARNEILDLLREYIAQDEKRTILITSHISTDLESLCDDIF